MCGSITSSSSTIQPFPCSTGRGRLGHYSSEQYQQQFWLASGVGRKRLVLGQLFSSSTFSTKQEVPQSIDCKYVCTFGHIHLTKKFLQNRSFPLFTVSVSAKIREAGNQWIIIWFTGELCVPPGLCHSAEFPTPVSTCKTM